MSDVPGWECLNHFYGPPVQCACQRFFENTNCDPARFYKWFGSTPQTSFEWTWLDQNEWLHPRFTGDPCEWDWDVNDPTPDKQVRLRLSDNSQFDPIIFPFSFKAKLDVLYNVSGFFSAWTSEVYFGFSAPVARNVVWAFPGTPWSPLFGNNPLATPPVGLLLFDPQLCKPGWSPGENPS